MVGMAAALARRVGVYRRHLFISLFGDAVMSRQELVDRVIEEMKLQIADNDWTVIEGLLAVCSVQLLKDFLPNEGE